MEEAGLSGKRSLALCLLSWLHSGLFRSGHDSLHVGRDEFVVALGKNTLEGILE
jgi:hypothetical protein